MNWMWMHKEAAYDLFSVNTCRKFEMKVKEMTGLYCRFKFMNKWENHKGNGADFCASESKVW